MIREALVAAVAAQVRRNCLVGDARAYGYFSLCGLLMRLRELYKREHDLPPWARVETPAILPWVGEREALWQGLEEAALEPVRIGDECFDPFDEEGIGARLEPLGLLYAAGRGPGEKPLFVLGEAAGRRDAGGVRVDVVGRELAHDLTPTPGMSRPGRILLRREPMRFALWAALEDAGAKEEGPAADALAASGIELRALLADPGAHAAALEALARRELDTALYHELGEMAEGRRRGEAWAGIRLRAGGSKAAILARGLRDALADAGAGGTLERLIAERRRASLALFAAADPGLRRKILPEARRIWELARGGAWGEAERVRAAAERRLTGLAGALEALWADQPARAEAGRRVDRFEEELLGKGGRD